MAHTTTSAFSRSLTECLLTSAIVARTTVLSAPPVKRSTSVGHCRSKCDGARTRVALSGMNPSRRRGGGGGSGSRGAASMRATVMTVFPYPTSSASTPPRTTRGTRARASSRQLRAGRVASATSSSMKGAAPSSSCSSIHESERCCSGRSASTLPTRPLKGPKWGGWGAAGSCLLEESVSGGRPSFVSQWRTMRHESSAAAVSPPTGTSARARIARASGLADTSSSPSSALPTPGAGAARCLTPKAAGRRLSACSYAPACTGSSSAETCPREPCAHCSLGIAGAQTSQGDPPADQAAKASAAPRAVHSEIWGGRSSRSVIHEIASNLRRDFETAICSHSPFGHAAASSSERGTAHRTTGTAAGAVAEAREEASSASFGGAAG
mmetsp:Transcript_10862/g.34551  ORF Transcript_10862/g.34551 Transcript_10862/m.34551 type:complete len:382 (-) Transcript_10862:1661-2806(-)